MYAYDDSACCTTSQISTTASVLHPTCWREGREGDARSREVLAHGAAGRRVGGLRAGVLAPEPELLGDVSTEALVPARGILNSNSKSLAHHLGSWSY